MRARRLDLGLSQNELARRIGVTFQQVQKYEAGANRMGASRLLRSAEALEVPVTFFFEGSPAAALQQSIGATTFAAANNPGVVRILKALHRIKSTKARKLLVGMAEELAGA